MSCWCPSSNGRWGVRQPACVSALVTLYSRALRGSLRGLSWTAEVSLVELALAIFFLAPIANAPLGLFYLCSGRRPRPVATGVRLTAAAERSRVAHAGKLTRRDAGLLGTTSYGPPPPSRRAAPLRCGLSPGCTGR